MQLVTQIDREEAAVEQFKTNNALLQNSLAYVETTSASLGEAVSDPEVALVVGRLANDLLYLIRSPNGETEQSIRIHLAGMQALLARRGNDPDLQVTIEMLVNHARLLSDMIPAVDGDLRRVAAESTGESWTRLSAAADARHAAQERLATRFQAAILLTTALLLIVLIRLAVLLRRAVRRQRRRTRLERAIATVSMDLVGRHASDTEDCLPDAVETLGRAFDADRTLLSLQDGAVQSWKWPAIGWAPDESWPQRAFEVLRASSALETDLIRVPATAGLPAGGLHNLLAESDIAACAGAVLRFQTRPIGLFMVGWTRPPPEWAADDGLLRMAAEIVGNAARRRVEQRARAALEERQVQARRLEALGTFASGIAHNFNNVIGAVLGYAEMAAEGVPPDATVGRYVQEIHNAGERAQDLMGRILEFGTRSRSSREMMRIDDLLVETASMLCASLPAKAVLAIEPGARPMATLWPSRLSCSRRS